MPGFERVGEEEIHRAWLFSLVRVDMVDPDGHAFERFVVHHPGAVHVVPVHDDGRVTLVRQYRAAIDRMVLEVPAGTCDVAGEPLEVTARRELAEEAGLEAATLVRLIGIYNTPGMSDQHSTVFLATGLTPCATARHGVEEGFMTVEEIRLDSVDALIADGTLVDETTVLGLLLARAHLQQSQSR